MFLISDLMSYDDSTDLEILRSGHGRIIRLSVRPSGKLKKEYSSRNIALPDWISGSKQPAVLVTHARANHQRSPISVKFSTNPLISPQQHASPAPLDPVNLSRTQENRRPRKCSSSSSSPFSPALPPSSSSCWPPSSMVLTPHSVPCPRAALPPDDSCYSISI